MSKKLRYLDPIKIAPDIVGWLDEKYNPIVKDERLNNDLDANDVFDKILIYERQVKDWFLNRAENLISQENNGFIVLMICMSYLEGVEQYRRGESSNHQSRVFFISALNRIYPNQFSDINLGSLYSEARCGLFHNGMVQGKIIINYTYPESINFEGTMDIKINPKKMLEDIIVDFDNFLVELKENYESRDRFNRMYSNV
ncbi:hypothetical protein [Flavobacterium ginsenosidimutans]|uniref:Phage protein n=1 Tax=Flavobacterium ginsenosidimutans TaxID=687844 RepID=A0ABZ2Q2N2_9FLAO|nr:hypothetical protein [Flavobacterium ginsenosidimutans]KAF2326626.1 hypothetical protein DM444_22325 [Flavobacterium ginsenosidimutans]